MTPAPVARASSLYVGGLDARVCTELLHDVFSLAGTVTLCRVVSDKHTGASMGFGFVDYAEHATALAAKELLHGRTIYGHELTVDWAHANSNAAAGRGGDGAGGAGMVGPGGEDISNHYCLFIGNLDTSVTDDDLRAAFSAFGQCSSAQVSRDSAANSRRCAFVSFKDRSAAQAAIDGLNGQVIADRPMRVDWARTKTNAATRAAAMGLPEVDGGGGGEGSGNGGGGGGGGGAGGAGGGGVPPRPMLEYVTVAGQTPPTFTTAYISGLPPSIDEQTLRAAFEIHGAVADIRIPESARSHGGDKVYAFVVYAEHESAARAVYDAQNGLVVAGRHVTVQWGRESSRAAPPSGGPMGSVLRDGRMPMGMGMARPGGVGAPPPHAYGYAQPPHAGYQPQHLPPQPIPSSYLAAAAPAHAHRAPPSQLHHVPGGGGADAHRSPRPPY